MYIYVLHKCMGGGWGAVAGSVHPPQAEAVTHFALYSNA